MNLPSVAVIILNYNNWKESITCLESVFNLNYKNYFVVVVDNGSKDDSIAYLRNWARGEVINSEPFPDHPCFSSVKEIVKPIEFLEYERRECLIKNGKSCRKYKETFACKCESKELENERLIIIDAKRNLGYAGGNNVGLRYSINYLQTDYFMILNNDTAVEPDLIYKLVKVFDDEEDVGICGPVEYSYNKPYCILSAGGKFGLYTGIHKEIKSVRKKTDSVDWISGCCLLIKGDLIAKIGYFDERFFLYVEEVDFTFRLKKRGYKAVISSEASIWHKGGEGKKDMYFTRNRLLFALKHLNNLELMIFIPIHFVKWVIWRPFLDVIRRKGFSLNRNLIALKEGFFANNEKVKGYVVEKREEIK